MNDGGGRDGTVPRTGRRTLAAIAFTLLLAGGAGLALLPGIEEAKASPPGGDDGAKAPAAKPAAEPAKAAELLVDLGNAVCPIQGGKVDGKTWSEWKGLRVGHCCPMCVEDFKAAPEAALEKAGIEWKAAAAAVKKANDAKAAYEKALADLKAKWKVVEASPEVGARK